MFKKIVILLFYMSILYSIYSNVAYTYIRTVNTEYTTYSNANHITLNKCIKIFRLSYIDDIGMCEEYYALYVEDILISYFVAIEYEVFMNIKYYKQSNKCTMFFYSGDIGSEELLKCDDGFDIITKYNKGKIIIIIENNDMCLMIQYKE